MSYNTHYNMGSGLFLFLLSLPLSSQVLACSVACCGNSSIFFVVFFVVMDVCSLIWTHMAPAWWHYGDINSGSRTARTFEFGRTHVVRPKGKHQATIVWLHGLSDNGSRWCCYFCPQLSSMLSSLFLFFYGLLWSSPARTISNSFRMDGKENCISFFLFFF